MRQKFKQHLIGLLLDIEDGLWFEHCMFLSAPGTTNIFAEYYSRVHWEHYLFLNMILYRNNNFRMR